MTQQRLTHPAMMKVHADILQGLDLQTLMNSLVSKTPERIAVFLNNYLLHTVKLTHSFV